MKKLSVLILFLSVAFSAQAGSDSLIISGRIICDSTGMANVHIAGTQSDADGYFRFTLPAGTDTLIMPSFRLFEFSPPDFHISANDTLVDSLLFVANRIPKKVIVIAGQSNAENVGEPRFFIPDSVDEHIPYYLAYSHGEFGLSTLELLTNFGMSESFIQEYNRGFGIEMLLARTLYKHYTDSLAVMKIAFSGTTLNEDWQVDGRTYPRFIRRHDSAVEMFHDEGYEPQYIGFFWFQGVGDRTPERAPLYAENLDEFITRTRDRFPNASAVDSLPFVCVRTKWRETSYENMVRAAQMGMDAHRGQYTWIDIDDCDNIRYSETNRHFNGNALNRIGYKLAVAYLDLVGEPIDSNITVSVEIEGTGDTSIFLHLTMDTTFSQPLPVGSRFDFTAKLGNRYVMRTDQAGDRYNISPFARSIPFAYDQSALYQPVYTFTIEEIVGISDHNTPAAYRLTQNYPNPFNTSTMMQYELPEVSDVKICIYDISGRRIMEWSANNRPPGTYKLVWNGTDQHGKPASGGVYILRMTAGIYVSSKKMLLLK